MQTKAQGKERAWPVGEQKDVWVQLGLVHSRKASRREGQGTQQGLRVEDGHGERMISGWQGRSRIGGRKTVVSLLLAVRMCPTAGEDGQVCVRETLRARTDGAQVARGQ